MHELMTDADMEAMSDPEQGECKVSVQRNHRGRWAYSVVLPRGFMFVSEHRYGSRETAMVAGLRAAAGPKDATSSPFRANDAGP